MHHDGSSETIGFTLDGTTVTIGRDSSCTVRLEGLGISRRHAELRLDPANCTITDCGSTFGVRVNGEAVSSRTLGNGDLVTLGVREYRVEIRELHLRFVPTFKIGDRQSGTDVAGGEKELIRIGRDPEADLVLSHPLVSRIHASARPQPDGTLLLSDNGSANGTFVNGRPVSRAAVSEGDIIQIGPYRLFVREGRIARADDGDRIRLEAFNLTVRLKKRTILDRAGIVVPAGEFVAILGPSGAGKSTLVRALCGRQRIDGGAVYANQLPLRQFVGAFASTIGFVTQENLLHPELTVMETFNEQCLLRLPRDSNVLERESRIRDVLELLELEAVRTQRISELSGGQAKRVHLGVELLASPALIVLDEPLAGLDPGLVRKFMQLFRRISDRGHTVLLTTHTLEQIEFCDRIVFMNRGTIVFAGQPSELEKFFGSSSLADIYEKVDESGNPAVLSCAARAHHSPDPPLPAPAAPVKLRKPKAISLSRQYAMLLCRYIRIMLRDRRNFLLMLLQAPLIALFLAFVFQSTASFLPLSFYFCVTISAIWVTGINAAQEIAREWRLLDREYRAGLSLSSYLGSKVTVALMSAVIQGALFWLALGLLFKHFPLSLSTILMIFTGTIGGGLLGLAISSLSGTVGRAITTLPIVFIPQIFFSGILIPFDRMSEIGRVLSHCTVSRPVYGFFKHVCILEQPLTASDSWQPLFLLWAGLIILMAAAVRIHCSGRR